MSAPLDSGSSAPASETGPVETTQATSGSNPSWDGLLTALPAEFHGLAKEHLSRFDQNYNDLNTKYAPYKDFEIDKVQRGLGIYEGIDKDPVAFYNQMKSLLEQQGLLSKDAANLAQAATQQQTQTPPVAPVEEYLTPDQQRIKDLEDQLKGIAPDQQKFKDFLAKQDYDKEVAKFAGQIDSDIARLKIPPNDVAIVMKTLDRMIASKDPNATVDAAYAEYTQLVQQIRAQPTASSQSPYVVNPAGGGIPPSQGKAPHEMTTEERAEMFHQRLKQAGG